MKYLLTAFSIIAIDQITKFLIRMTLDINQSVNIIGNFFRITYIRNSGAAFNMLSGNRYFLIVVPIIAIILAAVFLWRNKKSHYVLKVSLTLIIAGGFGNLIDRIVYGEVTDMLDFSIFSPVFNVADISVTFGCIGLLFYVLIFDNKKNQL